MTKTSKKIVEKKVKKIVKYFLRDTADRDFGNEVKLVANQMKEVDKKTATELKKKYPYLELLKK